MRNVIKLLRTAKSLEEIETEREQILQLIPAAAIMIGYDQQNSSHQYDLWGHCIHTVLNLPRNLDDDMLYLAALLHDIGKPDCQCDGKRPDDINKHYYGHPEQSATIVRTKVIPHFEDIGAILSEDEKRRLLYYVEHHDDRVSLRRKHLRRHLGLASFEEFQKLMLLQVADAKAHVMMPVIEERVEVCSQWAGKHGHDMLLKLQGEKEQKEQKELERYERRFGKKD